ncbi:NAD(P)/FAD-dependent oxidoreductase [Tuwongella immobilis]|uniref:NADH:ubiquinone reductase (non-electrogenic) n=1 Tax=Tuwongella immobilis TaxID=692036 RepID=A0A6C2YKC6_9BACT|nr:NAD(P)/FAD-dependent oxidoreductase [Tuwongella immobilis]VIP02028.1 pyridine nucleotide-disulfide oxidoreductase : FAD-dependent pyridine nucleotide-disulfide oxidoreductase OS=Chroococcidiopsis thermalis PCC 7203 GN=Chro_1618 PE=4 SV=1: Pyr_redox_2: Pyr_redox: Pyr_redox [Tuwongella immobilis]VTS00171.1 pyridine nucleotide-disulfide oxidoreductase : FAD-dependent pyridine nucleotide-disulfide oxidoreductase OS=Chroococcidiopsis thermalis PCC 7203 GN=Chro_1618 PE=4 SV=1: Pyr_redox_2: Pyr_redox
MADAIHRVVIIGGGFGGLNAAQALRRERVDVTLIDRRNFHLFQPLLYQVATGALSPANIASPLRSVLKNQPNTRVMLGDVTGFDISGKEVVLADGTRVGYDSLIVAAGAGHSYFAHPEWEAHAPGLKTIEDATAIRRRVLQAFEDAELHDDPQVRAKLLNFVIVGAGPTGVEMAGAISELAHHTLRKDFRSIDPATARIVLLEHAPRVLMPFHPNLSERARRELQHMGVEVVTGAMVTDIQAEAVTYQRDGQTVVIPTRTVVWAAGVKASPLGKMLADATGANLDRAGRIEVEPDLTLPGHRDLYVIGDMALGRYPDGKTQLPGVAPVAMQQGKYAAKAIVRRLRNSPVEPFRYWDKGSMATIGRAAAVADLYFVRFGGYLAWLAWLFIHLMYIVAFQNRLLVLFQWFGNYLTRNRAARLITEVASDDNPQAGTTPNREMTTQVAPPTRAAVTATPS